MSTKISVIIPVYNSECFLEECIKSVLAQSFADFELILVDDGSLDASGAICDTYEAKDSRIRVIHQTNRGQAAARNHAISIAQGEWICFVDSDDLIHPDMLKALLDAALDANVNISACGYLEAETVSKSFFFPKEMAFKSFQIQEESLEYFYRNPSAATYWCVWAKLIKKSIVESIPFEEGRIYEDNAVMCQWLYAAKTICVTDAELYYYRVNLSGTTKSQFNPKRLDYLWALQEQIKYYNTIGYHEMTGIIAGRFLDDAKWMNEAVNEQLNDSVLSESVIQQMKEVFCDYRKYLPWQKWKQEEMDLFLYPRKKTLYKARHIVSSIKRRVTSNSRR